MHLLLAYISSQQQEIKAETYESLLPIGLCSLHAMLRSQNVPVTLANLSGMKQKEILTLLKKTKPTVAGLSQWTHNRHTTIELARIIKKTLPDCAILLGGGHASEQAEQILYNHPEIDIILIGEGEETLPELLEAIKIRGSLELIPGIVIRKHSKPFRTQSRSIVKELDNLPFQSRYLHEAINVNSRIQAEFISSARGCPAACTFCSSPSFWGRKVRNRSVNSVIEEILFIKEKYGLIYISLRDDTFTADRRRTVDFCRQLIDRRLNIFWNCQSRAEVIDKETLQWMRKAGCECVQLGVESGSPDILKLLNKNISTEQVIRAADLIHQSGINLSVYLISGIPEETKTNRKQTIDLIKRIKPDDLQIAPLAYYPGTALFQSSIISGKIDDNIFETSRTEAVLAKPDGLKDTERLLSLTRPYQNKKLIKTFISIQKESGYSAVTAMLTGDLFLEKGNFKEAEKEYLQITETEPDHPWGWYLLGELYEQAGKAEKAVICFENVLKLVPNHQPTQEILGRSVEQKRRLT